MCVRSPLVGRDEILESMQAVVSAAIDFQTPQLISIIGNQGTGKTRLIDELVGSLEGRARVVAARANKDGGRHHVVARLLRARFGIAEAYGAFGIEEFPLLKRWFCDLKQRPSYSETYPDNFIRYTDSR